MLGTIEGPGTNGTSQKSMSEELLSALQIRSVKTENGVIECELCKKQCKTEDEMEIHKLKHATRDIPVYKFRCEEEGCGQTFNNSMAFEGHINKHKGQHMFLHV